MAPDNDDTARSDYTEKDGLTDSADEYEAPTDETEGVGRPSRRSFLGGVAASAIATAGFAGSASATPTYHGISFDRTVNAVDDLGMDDTGSEPIDGALDSALESGTLVEFPLGDYLVTQHHGIEGLDRVGIRGTGSGPRDVRLFPPQDGHTRVLDTGSGAGAILVENVSFDELDDQTSQLSMLLRTSGGSAIKDVEFLGRTPDDSKSTFTLTATVDDPDGVTLVENFTIGADGKAVPVTYPDGVQCLRVSPAHQGELIIRNPDIRYRNSNATRLSGGSGVFIIEGGQFINNQNTSVRFSAGDHPSKVSSARDCYILADGSRNSADAIRLDSGSSIDSGSVFENIEVEWTKDSGRAVISAPSWANHGAATFRGLTVRNEGSNTSTVFAEDVGSGDTALEFENCVFTGSGGDFVAQNRPGSEVRDSCVDMPNASVSGFETTNISSGCSTDQPGSSSNEGPSPSINVTNRDGLTVELSGADSTDPDGDITGYSWDVDGSSYTGQTVSHTFESAGSHPVSLTVEDDDGATATTSTEVSAGLPNSLSIQGTGVATNYVVEVSGSLAGVNDTIEDWDDVSGSSADGWVTDTGDVDEFTFDGELTAIEFREGEAEVFVDGEQIDPSNVGNEGPTPEVTVAERDGLTLDLSAAQSTDPDGTVAAYRWDVADQSYTGETVTHTFESSGSHPVSLTVEDDDGATASTTTNVVAGYEHSLWVQGTGVATNYVVEVSGSLAGVNDTIEDWDDLTQNAVDGWVTDTEDVDEFTFEGEVTRLEFIEGETEVFVDGEQVTPGQFSNEGPTATIDLADRAGLTVELSGADSSDPDGDIIAYSWDVDGTDYAGQRVSHTFGSGGTYPVSLTVEDDWGATATASTEVTVEETETEPNTLRMQGTGVATDYVVEVSGTLSVLEDSAEEWDEVGESHVDGWVTDTEDVDEFSFGGEITRLEFREGEGDVYVNGEPYDGGSEGDDGNDDSGPVDMSIRGTGEATHYEFEVDGTLKPVSDTIEEWDEVSDSGASGWVTDPEDVDEFTLDGEVTSFSTEGGDVVLTIDGEEVDPSSI